jgi:hypothetical protein
MKPINVNKPSITVLTLLDTLADSDKLTLLSSCDRPIVVDILPTILSLIPFFSEDGDKSDLLLVLFASSLSLSWSLTCTIPLPSYIK